MDTFDFHHSMLADELRTRSFLDAILATVGPGDVVVDIGSGTGVLSLFAAMAGAARVYAIEREPVIDVARNIAHRNGLSESITFIEGLSTDIELPERANVLVSETIGNVGLDEGIITWIADAKQRLLTPDASIIPLGVEVIASLVSVPREYEMIERWSRPLLDLDFSPLARIARNNFHWVELSRANLVSRPLPVFRTRFSNDPDMMSGLVQAEVFKDAVCHGIGVWFRSELTGKIRISNEPPNLVPSWEQGFLPLETPIEVRKSEAVELSISSSRSGDVWTWRVGSQREQSTNDGGFKVAEVT